MHNCLPVYYIVMKSVKLCMRKMEEIFSLGKKGFLNSF